MMRYVDRYADGCYVSARRHQKAELLARILAEYFPADRDLRMIDFGCADGAIPLLLLQSSFGGCIERIIGITLLDYNDLPEKPAHTHPRFERLFADLEHPLDALSLADGAYDAVLATGFLHYCRQPEIPFQHAARLLKPGGVFVAGLPAPWVSHLRYRGIPGLLPANTRICTIQSCAAWRRLAETCGFREVSCRAVQWLGTAWSASCERWLRVHKLPHWCGTHALAMYRRD